MTIKIKNTSDVENNGIFCLISGVSGVGKTSLAKTLPDHNTLIVSQESGLLSLKGTNYSVIETDEWSDFVMVAEGIKTGNIYKAFPNRKEPFRNYFIDSLTEIMDKYVAELKPLFPDKKDSFKMWDMYTSTAIDYIKFLRDSKECNIFMTCLTTQEKDGMHLVDQFDFSGAKLKDKVKSFFDLSLHMKSVRGEDGNNKRMLITSELESVLAKDRSGLLQSKIIVEKDSKILTDVVNIILS